MSIRRATISPGGAPTVVAFGELNLHITLTDAFAGFARVDVGGSPAFVARQAKALGALSEIRAVAGNDATGSALVTRLRADAQAPDRICLRLNGSRTAKILVQPRTDGESEMTISPSDCLLSELVELAPGPVEADVVHVAGFPGTEEVQHRVLGQGNVSVIDLGYSPWLGTPALVDQAVAQLPPDVTIVQLNGAVVPDAVLDIGRRVIREGRAEICLLTLGSEGALLLATSGEWYQPAPLIMPSCTVGAGDSFGTAFALAFSVGWEPERALNFAQIVAARSVENLTEPASLEDLSDVEVPKWSRHASR